jgi:hypothetical protein
MVTGVLRNTKCNKCDKEGVLTPFIIPPTWSKTVEGTPLPSVWAAAVDAISKAFQIVVVGYSMPSTDTFFQYLMTLGLQGNPNLHRVVVVNRDGSDELRRRYERCFQEASARDAVWCLSPRAASEISSTSR